MASAISPVPACLMPERALVSGKGSYRHNPYAYTLLHEEDRDSAAVSFVELYNGPSAEGQAQVQKRVSAAISSGSKYGSTCPSPAPQPPKPSIAGDEAEEEGEFARAAAMNASLAVSKSSAATADSGNDDGVSETSSEAGSGERSAVAKEGFVDFCVTGSHHLQPCCAVPQTSVIRYASVNFRFGSAWFVAPFRTFPGDMVVVQYPGNNNSLHMGLVSSITTSKPITFYTEDNMDSNYLSPEELQTVPRLLRHARDFDKETKLDLRSHDLRSLANARKLAEEMGAPIQFLDAEWLLDLSAVTFLVKVYGNAELADQLVDELAMEEGAEVVFTYPVSSSMY